MITSRGLRQRLSLISKLEQRDNLHYIAEAGAKIAISHLKEMEPGSFDSFTEPWANNPESFSNIPVGSGFASISYDFFCEISQTTQVKYGLVDEQRKINLNTADAHVLERLFRIILGFDEAKAQELAACVIDWRDKDSESSAPSGSSEDFYYNTLEYPYEAKDANFEALEELLLVKGMDQAAFNKLRDQVTVFGDGRVNINTASADVLMALGLSSDLAQMTILLRAGEDLEIGTPDDHVFETVSDIVPSLSQRAGLPPSDIEQLSSIVNSSLKTNSDNFTIKSRATLPGRKAASEVTSVVDRQGKVFYWQETQI